MDHFKKGLGDNSINIAAIEKHGFKDDKCFTKAIYLITYLGCLLRMDHGSCDGLLDYLHLMFKGNAIKV